MNDRELLEWAAKAHGNIQFDQFKEAFRHVITMGFLSDNWNPLSDDGDALRLAVRLKLNIEPSISRDGVYVGPHGTAPWAEDAHESQDIFGATRRAIVRAAAEIGKAMP